MQSARKTWQPDERPDDVVRRFDPGLDPKPASDENRRGVAAVARPASAQSRLHHVAATERNKLVAHCSLFANQPQRFSVERRLAFPLDHLAYENDF